MIVTIGTAVALFSATIIANAAFTNPSTTNSEYDRSDAYSYMTSYTTDRNTDEYASFSGIGGDCTNFVSQVVKAGGMAFTSRSTSPTTNHWYYYTSDWGWGRTATWTGAHEFRQHWGDVNGQGKKRAYRMTNYTVASALSNLSTIRNDVWAGDVIQHTRYSDGKTYHSQAVYGYPSGDVTIANHDGLQGDDFESLKGFLQRRVNEGRGSDYVSVIQIKSGY